MLRIWCGLQQLYLVMKRVFNTSLECQLYLKLTNVTGQLLRQANLISNMRSARLNVGDVQCISMFSSTNWLVEHRSRVQHPLDQKKPGWEPSKVWWILLHVMSDLASEAKAVFIYLQGLEMTVYQQ